MPLDPRIPMGIEPVQIPNILAQYAQMAQILNAKEQNEMARRKFQMLEQEHLRDRETENQLRAVMGQSGGNPEIAIRQLLQFGTPKSVELASKLHNLVKKPEKADLPFAKPSPRDFTSDSMAKFAVTRNPADLVPVPETQRPESQPEIVKLSNFAAGLRDDDPVKALIRKRIELLTTRQPAVNVYSGSLTAGVDAQGNPVFVQPSGRPDTPPRIVPNVFPSPKPADAKADQAAAEGAATLSAVETRVKRMADLLKAGSPMTGSVTGPAGLAARMGETVSGIVSPNVATPAIDYQNEMRLLLSDVRKIVERDPNLSKDEREALYETLGGGFWQTPGSALRTLNNVLDKVRSSAVRGKSTARPKVPRIGTIEQGYRFKGGDPADSANWEKAE